MKKLSAPLGLPPQSHPADPRHAWVFSRALQLIHPPKANASNFK